MVTRAECSHLTSDYIWHQHTGEVEAQRILKKVPDGHWTSLVVIKWTIAVLVDICRRWRYKLDLWDKLVLLRTTIDIPFPICIDCR